MTYLYEELSAPTRLYIKQCSHCNLKYFGKTILEDIQSYEGSGIRWQRHLKKHDAKSIHLWNSDWYYDTSIIRFATKFSNINRIAESKEWANLAIENGIQGGYLGEDVTKRASITRKETMSSKQWKSTIGKEHARKISETKSDPKWKETVGKEASIKIGKAHSELKQSYEWKSTIGKSKIKKYKDTIRSQEWKDTIGKQKSEKLSEIMATDEYKEKRIKSYSETVNNSDWLATKGKERSKKMSQKAKNRKKFECQYCKGMFWKTHLKRWHGENCKHKGL